jgi:putative SOS response-associated peptidase YedK
MRLLLGPVDDYLCGMCSRYTLTSPHEAVRAHFGYLNEAIFPPRYNIAPSQPVAIVRNTERGGREMALVRWGLIPSWVKDPREFKMLINARSESAADKPSFRAAVRHKRCLVPADGFYEWIGAAGAKRPHLIRARDRRMMGLAAIYENWLGADGSEIETMAILTTAANTTMAVLHDRMPVIIPPEQFDLWLDCRPGTATHILDLMAPAPDDLLDIVEVNRRLNNPRNEGPDVQEPVAVTGSLL